MVEALITRLLISPTSCFFQTDPLRNLSTDSRTPNGVSVRIRRRRVQTDWRTGKAQPEVSAGSSSSTAAAAED
uniref:Uncharacterized protein n=1 Tax=Chromera velia CCMP2878 TaxID=1169474 RepID=A0A0G4FF23_9ALVE|eukprot:Cvel_16661.t1-p1 / transcript=Cvel_16661.t1 / gene=Cvel_16661 / organism=Chromera_velia_CCMP2878 / gene_product=hypothetical protein / transcript_product=hypothetical protein / location=Cvel_scaffold1292:33736-35733(-) / protein_length=72 / sequence_SO=supercontig / SO=protein_coding / is_pseudo=false